MMSPTYFQMTQKNVLIFIECYKYTDVYVYVCLYIEKQMWKNVNC